MERLPAADGRLTAALRGPVGLAFALLLGLAAAGSGAAAAPAGLDPNQRAYLEAMVTARDALDPAHPGNPGAAASALSILRLRAPAEIDAIRLLQSQPPQTIPARTRLEGDIAAMSRAVSDSNPGDAAGQLRSILAQSRYHPDQGPLAFVANLFAKLIRFILTAGGGAMVVVALLLLIGMIVLAVVLLVPSLRGPLRRDREGRMGGSAGAGEVPEYFRTAERLAADGAFDGAVRALAAGTMEMISGERSFTASPLTVREAFNRSGGAQVLRPLLRAFERSYYGHHRTGVEDYEVAAAAAHRYRELAAAASVAA